MPTYEYSCRSCDQVFEVFQSIKDAPLTTCPKCGQAGVKRLIGRGAGIIFKGSGFYETDYKRKSEKPEAGKPSDGSKRSESAAKPEASPKSESESGASSKPGKAG